MFIFTNFEDELNEPLSLNGWDNWCYDIDIIVDGSIVVKHKE